MQNRFPSTNTVFFLLCITSKSNFNKKECIDLDQISGNGFSGGNGENLVKHLMKTIPYYLMEHIEARLEGKKG